jgi:uncharacterized phage protein (TIGR02218 family)
MKSISPELDAHLSGECLTMATCWLCTRTDGVVFAATDHDADIVFDGVTYLANSGYTATDVETMSDLSVDNLEIQGFANLLDGPSITDDDLRAGLWDFAAIKIFQVNYADLTMGSISERSGTTGEISLVRGQFTAELRGKMQAFSRVIGRIDAPSCNADLGDARCTVNLAPFTVTGTIEGVNPDQLTLYDSNRFEPGPTGGVAITGITNANPGVVTTLTAHGFIVGESVNISGVIGPDSLNALTTVRNPTATTFELPVDTTDLAAYPAYTGGGTVTPVGADSGYFDFGLLTMNSGLNAGFSREIKSYVPGQFVLQIAFPYLTVPGDLYTAVAGCDKSLETCKTKFNNVVNFRGFPYIPGTDRIVQIGRRT